MEHLDDLAARRASRAIRPRPLDEEIANVARLTAILGRRLGPMDDPEDQARLEATLARLDALAGERDG